MWRAMKLGELVEYTKSNAQSSGLPYVGMENISSETMKLLGAVTVPESTSTTFWFDESHVLFGRLRPYLRKVLLPNFNGQCSTEIFCMKPSEHLMREYLAYWLLEPRISEKIEATSTGARMPRANMNALLEFEFPLPPLAIQKAIVAKLDAAFASIDTAIAAAEKNAENAKQLFQSYLSDVFEKGGEGWEIRKFVDIAQVKGGKRVPKGKELSQEKTGHPYLRVTDFGLNGTIDESSLRYISNEIFDQIKRYTINASDLYISIAGTIGRTGIIPQHLNGANLTENACKLVFRQDISNYFVYWFTQTSSFFEQAIEQTRTAAQPKLALSRLEQIELKIPTFAEQNRWVDEFQSMSFKVMEMKDLFLNKEKLLVELKQSLLQQAFSGQLVDA